tara:strand:- start:1323 stop:1916 length:594 start_codon:yes stop_codon:yes gene_type:complete
MVSDVDAGSTYVAASQLGTSANNVVQLTAAAKLPAVDGSLLTGITDNGKILQVVNVMDGASATGTTVFVNDDSIPQNTEGNQFITLAITPASASNKLKIEVVCCFSAPSDNASGMAALFQDSTVGALSAVINEMGEANRLNPVSFTHFMAAGTTIATTFKVRAGSDAAGTCTFNGGVGAPKFGGVMASSITITEIAA